MGERLRVLHVVPSFWPATAWGGPVFSGKALCDGLAARGIEVTVLTTDSAGPGRAERLALPANPARFEAGYEVRYAAKRAGRDVSPELARRLWPMTARADLVHLTGTYSFPTPPALWAARRRGLPLVWSPRGALQASAEWAGASSRRKRAFEALCRRLMPPRAALHVTSRAEARLSAARMPGPQVAVIPNSVDLPAPRERGPARRGGLRLLFLGRLHPKKGLEVLLEAMEGLPEWVALEVCGGGEAGYERALRARAAPLGGRVRFAGHVEGEARDAAFARADLFVLPSHSENFGNAVAEALARSVPVLVSTACPWEGAAREGCGRQVPPEPAALRAAILDLAGADLRAMGARGREWMARDFAPEAVAARMEALYRALRASP